MLADRLDEFVEGGLDEDGAGLERTGDDAVDRDFAGAAVAIDIISCFLCGAAGLFADQGTEPFTECLFGHGVESVAKGWGEAKRIHGLGITFFKKAEEGDASQARLTPGKARAIHAV